MQDGGGIELLDWIDITIFSEGEERLLVHFDPNWPDTGTYAVHTMFMRELYEQLYISLRYNVMQKSYINSCINKLSSIKCKAF